MELLSKTEGYVVELFGVNINSQPLIIAEIGINHNGDVELAKKMIDAAAEAGADVVKFQTFSPERLYVEEFAKSKKIKFGDKEMSLWDFIDEVKLSWDDTKKLKEYAESRGIGFLSTPFSFEDADFLESIGVEAFKVASTDLTTYPFIEHIAKKGKPIILSTGTSTIGEIEEAVNIIKNTGNDKIVLLHCISIYPAPPETIYLKSIEILKNIFRLPVGFSDHTEGIHIPIAAITLGAQVIEKHFTIDRNLPGPDQAGSMTPDELRLLRKASDEIWKALGDGWKIMTEDEKNVSKMARRSIVAKKDIPEGEIISLENVTFKRPAMGVEAKYYQYLIGKKTKKNVRFDEILEWKHIEGGTENV